MKTMKQLFTIALLFTLPMLSSAQKIKVTDGKIPSFVGEKHVLIAFDYSDMTVGKKKEMAYRAEKVKEKNEEEAGTGDAWEKRWVADREERFEGKFLELFNKHAGEKGLKGSTDTDKAKYKMLVKTIHTEPGFNVGVMKRPAHINLEVDIMEVGSDKAIGTMLIKKIPGTDGMGFDFDVGKRLQEAYAKGGKTIGKHFKKKLLGK